MAFRQTVNLISVGRSRLYDCQSSVEKLTQEVGITQPGPSPALQEGAHVGRAVGLFPLPQEQRLEARPAHAAAQGLPPRPLSTPITSTSSLSLIFNPPPGERLPICTVRLQSLADRGLSPECPVLAA